MPFFRQNRDIDQATTRPGALADLTAVSRLLRDNRHRFFSAPSSDLPSLMASAPVVLLASGAEVWGVAIAGWQTAEATWLRALGLADGVLAGDALNALMPPLYAALRARGVQRLYYAGDTSSDAWIQPAFLARGFARDTEVVVYEKNGHAIPAHGNLDVRVRRAQAVDLPAILALDRACFASQWVKDECIFGPALVDVPFFVIAELHNQPVGYAFATSHFNGRLVHLVRIAVHPSNQGQAIGVRLMAELVDFGREQGADTFTLNTQLENRTAQQLYGWFGFRRTGERQTVLRYDL